MIERIYHLIGHNFSQFQILFGHFVYKKNEIIKFNFRFDGDLSKK